MSGYEEANDTAEETDDEDEEAEDGDEEEQATDKEEQDVDEEEQADNEEVTTQGAALAGALPSKPSADPRAVAKLLKIDFGGRDETIDCTLCNEKDSRDWYFENRKKNTKIPKSHPEKRLGSNFQGKKGDLCRRCSGCDKKNKELPKTPEASRAYKPRGG